MQGTHMVPLTPVPTEFAGRVLVAKLGSAGILAELRGISQVYPAMLGRPEVWVEAEEEAEARELITTDTEDAFDAVDGLDGLDAAPGHAGRPLFTGPARLLLAAIAVVLLVGLTFGGRGCGATTGQSSSHSR